MKRNSEQDSFSQLEAKKPQTIGGATLQSSLVHRETALGDHAQKLLNSIEHLEDLVYLSENIENRAFDTSNRPEEQKTQSAEPSQFSESSAFGELEQFDKRLRYLTTRLALSLEHLDTAI